MIQCGNSITHISKHKTKTDFKEIGSCILKTLEKVMG
jgi:hypothetical protein